MGIYVESSPALMSFIEANVFDFIDARRDRQDIYGPSRVAIAAPAGNITARYNHHWRMGAGSHDGGVVPVNTTHADPLFTASGNGDLTLQVGSSLRNTGPTEGRYNDHDGTRNDIGAYGGHRYDPNGATTSKPVVMSLVTTPTQLLRGTDTTITIKSRAAIITP